MICIPKKSAVRYLKLLGFSRCSDWTRARLAKYFRVGKRDWMLTRLNDIDLTAAERKQPKTVANLRRIHQAFLQGYDVIVIDPDEPEKYFEDVTVKRERIPNHKRRRRYHPNLGSRQGNRNPGIIEEIVRYIYHSAKTRTQILCHLHEMFPDRDPNKMKRSIKRIVPSTIRYDTHFRCYRDARGRYYAE